MEQIMDGLQSIAQVSAVIFGVFVFIAVTLAAVSSYRRHLHHSS